MGRRAQSTLNLQECWEATVPGGHARAWLPCLIAPDLTCVPLPMVRTVFLGVGWRQVTPPGWFGPRLVRPSDFTRLGTTLPALAPIRQARPCRDEWPFLECVCPVKVEELPKPPSVDFRGEFWLPGGCRCSVLFPGVWSHLGGGKLTLFVDLLSRAGSHICWDEASARMIIFPCSAW